MSNQVTIGVQDMPDTTDTRSTNDKAWKSVAKGDIDARHARSQKMNVGGDLQSTVAPAPYVHSVHGEMVRVGKIEMTKAEAEKLGYLADRPAPAPQPTPQPSADPAMLDKADTDPVTGDDDDAGEDEVEVVEFSQEDLGSLMNSAADAIGPEGIAAAVEAVRHADFDGEISEIEIAQLVDTLGAENAQAVMAGAEQLVEQAIGHSVQALRLGNLNAAQQDSLAAHIDAAPTSVFVDALKGQPAALKVHISRWKG